MQHSLTNGTKTVRAINATAAGTSTVNGSWVDTLNFEGVRAVACLGTLTSTQTTSLKLQYSDDGSTSLGDANTTGSGNAADADSNKMLISELYKPTHRYVRPVVVRGTANAVIDSCVVELYLPFSAPVTADSTVSQQKMVDNPQVGTA